MGTAGEASPQQWLTSCISTILTLSHFLSVAHIWGHEPHTGASFNASPTFVRCLKRFLNGKKGGDPSLLELLVLVILLQEILSQGPGGGFAHL